MLSRELDDRFEYPLELDARRYCVPKAGEEVVTVPTTHSLALVHTYVRKTEQIRKHQTFVRDLESASTCRWLMVDHKNRMSFCSHHEALEESFGSKEGRRVMGLIFLRSDMLVSGCRNNRSDCRTLPIELTAYLDQLE